MVDELPTVAQTLLARAGSGPESENQPECGKPVQGGGSE